MIFAIIKDKKLTKSEIKEVKTLIEKYDSEINDYVSSYFYKRFA
jgi:hypothetical protein